MSETKKRLQNILAHRGVASRRRSGELVSSGKVCVDGKIITEKGLKLDPEAHEITVAGRAIPPLKDKRYFLVYKAEGVISTAKDTHKRPIVTEMLPEEAGRLYPAGRLDKDTVGLMLLTNDGKLANMVMHPSIRVDKEYIAEVSPPLNKAAQERFAKGLRIGRLKTSPCRIDRLHLKGPRAAYRIVLGEGRKRQIRRMFAKFGCDVLQLKRTRIGPFTINGMQKGGIRELSRNEVSELKEYIYKRGNDGSGKKTY